MTSGGSEASVVQPAYGFFRIATTWSGAEMRLMFGQLANVDGWIMKMAGAPGGGVKAIKVVRAVHPLKALYPMEVTDSGMVMLVNELQLSKAYLSMVVIESGMVMLANDLHPRKVLY